MTVKAVLFAVLLCIVAQADAQNPAVCAILYDKALRSVQMCEADAECGQIITGTSCGCTRELVARKRVSLDTLRGIMENCNINTIGTCDCPPADGFVCAEGRCAWNYGGSSTSQI